MGRGREQEQLARALADLPVAVICGMPGVGKSTLALTHGAGWPGPALYLKLTTGASIPHIAETALRRFGVARSELPLDDVERLDELWTSLDDLAGLLVLDDLHGLDAASRSLVIDSATRRLHAGRLIAATRELVPITAGMRDRLHLRLEGLDRADAAQLWGRLEELYGSSGDFETAWRRSLGNPYLLRQAHVATLTGDHPMLDIARSLDPEERRIAGAVALSHVPLALGIVLRLGAARPTATLDDLVTRLIVDVTADAEYTMHDLMREAIIRSLDLPTVDELRAALAGALPGVELDAVTVIQETARHLRALGRHADVARLLLGSSDELIRHGANAALIRELDALPDGARSPDLQLLHARTLARSILQTRRAYEELRPLASGAGAGHATQLLFATSAIMTGELADAEHALRALVDGPGVSPEHRAKAEYGLAWASAYRGNFSETLEIVDRIERSIGSRAGVRWSILRMFVLMAAGADEASAALAARLTDSLEADPSGRWSHRFTPAICAIVLATFGRLDDAERALRLAERGVRYSEDNVEIGWVRMLIRYERGERGAAFEFYGGLRKVLDRSGYLVGMVWTRAHVGRLLFLSGRCSEARWLLSETLEQCRAKGAVGLQRVVELASNADPLSQGWLGRDDSIPAAKLGECVLARVRLALRHACTGDITQLELMRVRATVPASPDHAFDRALLDMARALLASRLGHRRLAASYLDLALRQSEECGADPDVLPILYERLRSGRAVDDLAAAVSPRSVVIDCVRHEVSCGDLRIALATRVVLRRLLYAFVAADGYYLDRNAITGALWDADYQPPLHNNSVKSNIRRLRELLEGTRVVIQVENDGYRLSIPPGTAVVTE